MGGESRSASTKTSIRDSIERIVREQFPKLDRDEIITGQVLEVYDTEGQDDYGTCDIEPNNGDPTLFNVRLNGTVEGDKRGRIQFPKVGSDVIVQLIEDGVDSFVVLFTHVDKVVELSDVSSSSKVSLVTNNDPDNFEDITETGEATEIFHDGTLINISLNNESESKVFNLQVNKDNFKASLDDGTKNAYFEIVDTGNIDIKSDKNRLVSDPAGSVQPMALGDTLAQLLKDILSGLEAATVSTSIGTQPLINKATFTNIKGQVDTLKSAINFLQ